MSFFDKLNQIVKPVKRMILNSPVYSLLSQKAAVVTFTGKQTGEKIKASVDYIREQAVVYLFFNVDDERWKNLAKGSPVCMLIEGVKYSGWAEDLIGYEEFINILRNDPVKHNELEARYGPLDVNNIKGSLGFKKILGRNKLIRAKISR